ncbi:hypothetical protein [Candidatus Phytoplasma oryzae]|nr:hypothetical protein PIE28_01815 [Candidatus Phytoplasma oryzae]
MSIKIYGKHYETVPVLITLGVFFCLIMGICGMSYRYHMAIQQRKALENIDIDQEAIKLNAKNAEENKKMKEVVDQLLNYPVEVVRSDGTKEYYQLGLDENNNATSRKIKVIQPDVLVQYFTPEKEIYKTVDQNNNIQIIETLNYPIKTLKEKGMVTVEELKQAGFLTSVEEAKKAGLTVIEAQQMFGVSFKQLAKNGYTASDFKQANINLRDTSSCFDNWSLYQGGYDLKTIIKMYYSDDELEYLFAYIINKDEFFSYVQQKPLNSEQFYYFFVLLKKNYFNEKYNPAHVHVESEWKEFKEAIRKLKDILGTEYPIFHFI